MLWWGLIIMNKERFKELITLVEGIPEHKFNMVHIVSAGSENPKVDLQNHECGTTGCVAGYLPIYYPDHFDFVKFSLGWDVLDKKGNACVYAIATFLDIPWDHVNKLFIAGKFRSHPSVNNLAFSRTKSEQLQVMEWYYEQEAVQGIDRIR